MPTIAQTIYGTRCPKNVSTIFCNITMLALIDVSGFYTEFIITISYSMSICGYLTAWTK